MAVGVYGHLPVLAASAEEAEADCYSVFHGLSAALGLLAHASEDASDGGQWGMNDAGGPWSGADPTALCGWFQVVPMGEGREPLPLVPFTAATVATVARFGEFSLTGLEFYLPLPRAGPEQWRLMSGRSWFDPIDPTGRTPLRITLDSGTDPSVAERVDDLLDALDSLWSARMHFHFEAADDNTAVEFAAPSPWRWWLGDDDGSSTFASHTCTLTATAPEWSPIALGYTVAYVSEACRAVGIPVEIGVRIVRA